MICWCFRKLLPRFNMPLLCYYLSILAIILFDIDVDEEQSIKDVRLSTQYFSPASFRLSSASRASNAACFSFLSASCRLEAMPPTL